MTHPNTPREIPQFFLLLPDGRRLSARLWLPAAPPAPCILEYLPYRLRDGTATRDATTHPRFAAAGYACLRVDIAGSGDSDALFDDEYSERELADGESVIAWVASQAWCDGRVGVIGISWGGFNGLQLAARRAPALGAVVSVCSTVDRVEDDIHVMGGCLLTDNFNWGAQMTAYMTRPPDPAVRADWREVWLKRIEALPFAAADWLRRADDPGYWRHGSVRFDYSSMAAPVLGIGGWADGYVNAPLALAAALPGGAALIGPWEHKYPHLSRIEAHDFQAEVTGWFDRHLKGLDTAAPPPARLFMQEHERPPDRCYRLAAGRWVALAEWPDPAIEIRSLSLSPGRLGEGEAGHGEAGCGIAEVDTPLSVGEGAAYWCPGMRVDHELSADQREDDSVSLCFDTAPLEAPIEIIGRPCLEIAFTADRPVAQLVARLCDVAPSGASMRISYRPRNLCYPDTETPAGPVVLPGTTRVLVPGKRYTARILLNTCAHRLRAGHRLRLALSTSYWPVLWPTPERARIRLDLAACRLLLPVHPGAPNAPGPRPAQSEGDMVEAPTVHRPATGTSRRAEEEGVLVLETADDFGAQTLPGHGMRTESAVTQRFAIRLGDPLSAEHRADWHFALSRGSWAVSIDSTARMTASASHFTLSRHVTAREGDTVRLEREWTETIPRGFL
ncbi:MAG: CocE/NonD family hydrolase [Pseudomonadota bacterium]